MGLDITAYGILWKVEAQSRDEEFVESALNRGFYWKPGASLEWSNNTWPGRSAMRKDHVGPGSVVTELVMDAVYGHSQIYNFRAGSYSAYGGYRDFLARLGGLGHNAQEVWEKVTAGVLKDGPFLEQINFADNEGVIGSETAYKLLQDYTKFQRGALAEADSERWFEHAYGNWRRAFEIAAEYGAVDFH